MPLLNKSVMPDLFTAAKNAAQQFLNDDYNVFGVGVGFKEVSGIKSNKPCIFFSVEVKETNPAHMIPSQFEGFETDVIEERRDFDVGHKTQKDPSKPLGPNLAPHRELLVNISVNADQQKYDPFIGGCMIQGSDLDTVGTGGIVAKTSKSTELCVLTNAHVVTEDSKPVPATRDVAQPTVGTWPATHFCATVAANQVIQQNVTCGGDQYYCDAAICVRMSGMTIRNFTKGKVIGIDREITKIDLNPTVGQKVVKRGALSLMTQGTIDRLYASYKTSTQTYYNVYAVKSDTTDPFSINGDSGSAVLAVMDDGSYVMIGLLFAGGVTDPRTFCCQMTPICQEFGLAFN